MHAFLKHEFLKANAKRTKNTVNLEIFSRVLFSRNFVYAKFHENKTQAKSHCCLLILVNHALVVNF